MERYNTYRFCQFKYIIQNRLLILYKFAGLTLDEYLNILERVYLIDGLPIWQKRKHLPDLFYISVNEQ